MGWEKGVNIGKEYIKISRKVREEKTFNEISQQEARGLKKSQIGKNFRN